MKISVFFHYFFYSITLFFFITTFAAGIQRGASIYFSLFLSTLIGGFSYLFYNIGELRKIGLTIFFVPFVLIGSSLSASILKGKSSVKEKIIGCLFGALFVGAPFFISIMQNFNLACKLLLLTIVLSASGAVFYDCDVNSIWNSIAKTSFGIWFINGMKCYTRSGRKSRLQFYVGGFSIGGFTLSVGGSSSGSFSGGGGRGFGGGFTGGAGAGARW